MVEDLRWSPLPSQVVSDLGQLSAFGDPDLSRIIRVLQRQEGTASELARMLEYPESHIQSLLEQLIDLVLIRVVETHDDGDQHYRATAKMFNLKPEPRDAAVVTSPLTVAMLEILSREILTSAATWPDQPMAYEGRRARIPANRAVEFNDRLVELLREFWGDDLQEVEEDPENPMLAFAGVWYRVPE